MVVCLNIICSTVDHRIFDHISNEQNILLYPSAHCHSYFCKSGFHVCYCLNKVHEGEGAYTGNFMTQIYLILINTTDFHI